MNIPPAYYTLTITPPPGGGSVQTISNIPPGNVLTSSGGTLTIASVLGTSYYVIPPGVTGTVTTVAELLGSAVVDVGGTATIDAGIAVGGNTTINVDGGTATLSNGSILGALSGATINLDNGGTFSNGGGLITALNGSTINYGANGGTFIANAGGSLIDLSSTTINGFEGGTASDKIEFQNLPSAISSYSIATSGGSQTITLFSSTGATLGSVTVAGTSLPTGTTHQGQSGPLTVSGSGTTFTIDPVASVLTCFLAGTHIRTPDGDVNVETLKIGDFVVTADGRTVSVCWAGVTTVSAASADPARIMPIRIQAGALADNVPVRDLFVSPDHSMYLDGVFVPAQLLLNGTTITQCSRTGRIDYYHIAVEPHDVLVAEGAATESFLDISNRILSQQGVVPLFPKSEPKTWEDACAELILAGPQLDSIRATLNARAATIAAGEPEAAGFAKVA
ncbi:MAG: Hint domain-containing protein [Acidiphilium sp.]|nr:Hint domain-containing protein [Acidiphilium sp.]MDD4936964.1 Hint domain-containing protein [Acidiphilium sp.]